MFFSIIIPVYNRPQELRELLESLTKQSYQAFEIIVIEDGSTLTSDSVFEDFVGCFDLMQYYVKPNSGQGFSRNFGFERANGDYFIIFDSDCLVPPDYLEIVNREITVQNLDAYGGPDAAHASFTPIQKAISYSMTSPFTTGGIRGGKKRIGDFHPRSFNMGLSRKVYEKTGGFIITRLGEDIELSIRIHKLGFKTGLIPEAKVYHKRRSNFLQFYKQIHFFGRARINIYKFFPSGLKAVHFFPAVFTLGLFFSLIANLFNWPMAGLCNFMLALFILLVFFHSWISNKSAKVAFLSIFAAFVQLTAYGLGFMQDFWKRIILNIHK